MSVVRRDARRRWLLVGAAAVVLAALPAAIGVRPVRVANLDLSRLADRIRSSAGRPYQGFVLSSGYAGLPALPQLGDVADLLGTTTRIRVWYASRNRWRVDTIDTGTERDTYGQPGQEVTWDYGRDLRAEVTGTAPVRLPRAADLVPPELARRLMAAADRTPASGGTPTRLARLPAQRIAGIAAAGLRITPGNPATTIGRVDIWADPATGLPLRVQVSGRGATGLILDTRFLEVSRSAPAATALDPPPARPGISQTVSDADDLAGVLADLAPGPLPDRLAGQPRVGTSGVAGIGVYGTGLTAFVVLPVPRGTGFDAMRQATQGGGTRLDFPYGDGVLLAARLLTVLIVDAHRARRTYLMAGLVDPERLRQAGEELSGYRWFH